jgi:hypothetical protein
MAETKSTRGFSTENLLDAICDYLDVSVVDSETFNSSWNLHNPIRLEKNINQIVALKEEE